MKNLKKFTLVTLCLSFVLVFFNVANAAVYLLPYPYYDLVDSGGHLDWDYDTKYYSESLNAQNLWNGYKPGVIREDSVLVVEDVFVTDYFSSTDGSGGYTDVFNNLIAFNDYYFKSGNTQSITPEQRKKTVAHEFGHALGLGENNSGVAAIMRQGRYSYSTLHQDDKDSYDAAAKKY